MKSLVLLFLIGTATSVKPASDEPPVKVLEIESPARPESGEPRLSLGADHLLRLSWVEESEGTSSLWFATFNDSKQVFEEALSISSGDDWFVNWADTPGICALADGSMIAHWLQKTGEGAYDYEIRFSVRTNGSEAWSKPARLHDDDDLGEHGFVSVVPHGDQFTFVWLKVSPAGSASPHAALRTRAVKADGSLLPESQLDERTCTCCSTSIAQTDDGQLWVAYRDRSESEIRDIAFVRQTQSNWSRPAPLFDDRWTMPGCPVNGPVFASHGSELAAAWYTGAGADGGRVNLAFREGNRFGFPLRIDDGRPVGRPHLAMTKGGDTLIVWLEVGDEGAEWRLKRIRTKAGSSESPARSPAPGAKLVSVPGSRSSGFAQIERSANHIVFAWTDPATPPRVRTAILKLRP